MDGLQQWLFSVVVEEHTRIVFQVRLCDDHLSVTLQIHEKRQDVQPVMVDFRNWLIDVGGLEGIRKLSFEG